MEIDMDKLKIVRMSAIADDMSSIAEKVNESSKKRKQHSMNTLTAVAETIEIGKALENDFDKIYNADKDQSIKDNAIVLTCRILLSNIEKQKSKLSDLKNISGSNVEKIKKITSLTDDFYNSLLEVFLTLELIIEKDSEILLSDKLLKMKKKFQLNSAKAMNNITIMVLEDAEKAIIGSAKNLERGKKIAEKIKKTAALVESKDIAELKNLASEIEAAHATATEVNANSKSQYKFAEQSNQFTKNLHEDSMSIKEVVDKKHLLFEETLQHVTVLTVIISLKFKKYLEVERLFNSLEYSDDIRGILNELNVLSSIAIEDLKNLLDLNYNMTDLSHLNNKAEQTAVDLTEKEHKVYDTIKNEVEQMTKATAYPVEGSSKNMKNTDELTKIISELV
jgi:hypothetical protein